MENLRAGSHYPCSLGECQAWFPTDADCLNYLEWLRWPAGFTCAQCGSGRAWRVSDRRFICHGCSSRTARHDLALKSMGIPPVAVIGYEQLG